jgi:hypothetical protein
LSLLLNQASHSPATETGKVSENFLSSFAPGLCLQRAAPERFGVLLPGSSKKTYGKMDS